MAKCCVSVMRSKVGKKHGKARKKHEKHEKARGVGPDKKARKAPKARGGGIIEWVYDQPKFVFGCGEK